MSLSKEEIDGLMRLIAITKDDEIDCERCLAQVAEFAERELTGRSPTDGLEAVAQHLSVCAECREEYGVLLETLKAMDA